MDEVIHLNDMVTKRFLDVFQPEPASNSGGRRIPIIPTIGNNDIMPHNTMTDGPSRWTKALAGVWDKLIPESQRHTFIEGGWFTSEVIPGKLAVISLNTMYFYSSNSAVDGCEAKSEPGFEHMEWLKVQLKILRQRNMKAILIGHVAPARAGSKIAWEETCWQMYTLWLNRYRDVVIGSLYGHMNVDHFMMQDTHDVDILDRKSTSMRGNFTNTAPDLSVESIGGYFEALREQWSDLPTPPPGFSFEDAEVEEASDDGPSADRSKKTKRFLEKIGGPFAERYSVSLVSPSLVPNYFPTIRVFEYNITGLDVSANVAEDLNAEEPSADDDAASPDSADVAEDLENPETEDPEVEIEKKKKKNKKKKKVPKFKAPDPPPSSTVPGPAYCNQPLSWLSYTQYYANLTHINKQIARASRHHFRDVNDTLVDELFDFQVEYDTRDDRVFQLKDLTVRSYFDLASRVADGRQSSISSDYDHDHDIEDQKKKKKKGKKGKKKRDRVWRVFFDRAFVGYLDSDELDD